MASAYLEIQLYGPYRCFGNKDESVFHVPISTRKGVYFWTIPFENQYLTYYIGETGNSFVYRTMEHIQCYLRGFYRVYDPNEFAKGKKVLIWGGMWKPDRKGLDVKLEFIDRYPALSRQIYEYLAQFRLFLAPIDRDRRTRQRIEAAIATKMLGRPGVIGNFQDDDIRYWPRRSEEQPIYVKMKPSELIMGLNEELVV